MKCRKAPRSLLKLCSWSIVTLLKAGVLQTLINYAIAHSIDIVFLQETRFSGPCDFITSEGWRFINYNEEGDCGKENAGIGCLIPPKL